MSRHIFICQLYCHQPTPVGVSAWGCVLLDPETSIPDEPATTNNYPESTVTYRAWVCSYGSPLLAATCWFVWIRNKQKKCIGLYRQCASRFNRMKFKFALPLRLALTLWSHKVWHTQQQQPKIRDVLQHQPISVVYFKVLHHIWQQSFQPPQWECVENDLWCSVHTIYVCCVALCIFYVRHPLDTKVCTVYCVLGTRYTPYAIHIVPAEWHEIEMWRWETVSAFDIMCVCRHAFHHSPMCGKIAFKFGFYQSTLSGVWWAFNWICLCCWCLWI